MLQYHCLAWAAWDGTWLLIKLTLKGVVFPFFPYVFFLSLSGLTHAAMSLSGLPDAAVPVNGLRPHQFVLTV